MKILAIETSCDETAIAVVSCDPTSQELRRASETAQFTVLGNALLSQIEMHKEYGGVFPALAKREHAKNLIPVLSAALEEAELLREDTQAIAPSLHDHLARLLEREPGLSEAFLAFIAEIEPPPIDAIAVTAGPGLEPALWVGVNFAKALALVWDKPLVAVNHMEGHILAALAEQEAPRLRQGFDGQGSAKLEIRNVQLPVLALLISGGHTELVLMKEWLEYELVGQTRDDAVGEAFDKVARMLGLPYPGGPEISRLAEAARIAKISRLNLNESPGGLTSMPKLPRPMINENSCDFSFAGLKTAVLYLLKEPGMIYHTSAGVDEEVKAQIAREFEDAVAEVLWKKTARALRQTGAKTLVIGGGVSANTHIRRVFTEKIAQEFSGIGLRIPSPGLTTDNAVMIALAGYYRALGHEFADLDTLKANGNLSLS